MRRADRLFQIVQHLRGRRLTTAKQLAGWLEVSERTIYRDVRDLTLSGVPVDGEAGVGYRIKPGFDLPPIMFTLGEVEALVAGARMIAAWGGKGVAAHVRSALAKISLALPAARRDEIERTPLFAPGFLVPRGAAAGFETVRQAMLEHRKLRIEYVNGEQRASSRTIVPLGLSFWGTTWALAAWCEWRADFRNFRLDRIRRLELTDKTYEETAGRTIADFIARVNREDR
ncbi:MAG TPA: YafY family protein [Bryobacteraceae bacterium]|nr:YafY family protein [Bryobacteraceae bacterium]